MFAFLESVFHLPWMLAGLGVLAIPPLIHLLNRRRYEVVDWGAMQFLQVSEVTRRRLMIEELLLMLLRMALLAVLVLALAGPFVEVALPPSLATRPARDVVLVLDGSASMAASDEQGGPPPARKAKEWAQGYLDALGPGDTVAVLLARESVVPLVGALSLDRSRGRERLEQLPAPAGKANWPDALREAHRLLEGGQNQRREVILIGDDQRFSWADPDTLFRWELVGSELGLPAASGRPLLWYVNVSGERDRQPPSYGLGPLAVNRPVVPVDREVTFRGELLLSGQTSFAPPHRLHLEIDGKAVRDLPPPGGKVGSKLPLPRDGKVPFSFTHRFARPGVHLVSLVLEPDPPGEDRPAGHEVRDRLPGDNRQDFAIEVVPAVPVLLVTGERAAASSGSSAAAFLRDALAPARDLNPVIQLRLGSAADLSTEQLAGETRPRVVLLHNVPRLSPAQADALAGYLAAGGGVLVAPGSQVDATWYNDELFRGGDGWLPARLEGPAGDENQPERAFRPDPASFTHPILDVFRQTAAGGLAEARFPRCWQLNVPGQHSVSVPIGQLEAGGTKTPLFVERTYQAGRVLLAAVPFDASWRTNLIDLPAFVPLVHEAVYYLAGARATDFNLRPGQPIRYPLDTGAAPGDYRLAPPDEEPAPLTDLPGVSGKHSVQVVRHEHGATLVYNDARRTGVYTLHTPASQTVSFVVPPDPREADLSACSADDRQRVAKLLGVRYESDRSKVLEPPEESAGRQDLWLYLLLGLIGLLLIEVWLTRRLVMNRG